MLFALALYITLPWLILVGAACCTMDRGAPFWLRLSVSFSVFAGVAATAIILTEFTSLDSMLTMAITSQAGLQSPTSPEAESILLFGPLVIPALLIVYWLKGHVERRVRAG